MGAIAFATVFLLIVGATVAYLLLRSPGSDPGGSPGGTVASSPATASTDPTTAPVTESPSVEAERCWQPENERVSSNPSGRLRGGGLEVIPPAIFDNRLSFGRAEFVNDIQSASAHVEGTWYSTMIIGSVEWQPGIEYPGDRAASERILTCLHANAGLWGDTSGRTLHEQITTPVTVAGMSGYQTSATLKFAKHNLTKTDAEQITVTVVSTPEGPSVFITLIADGITEHEEAAAEAFDSLTGLSG